MILLSRECRKVYWSAERVYLVTAASACYMPTYRRH